MSISHGIAFLIGMGIGFMTGTVYAVIMIP